MSVWLMSAIHEMHFVRSFGQRIRSRCVSSQSDIRTTASYALKKETWVSSFLSSFFPSATICLSSVFKGKKKERNVG